ncbi:MAG: diacylglycerol kinase family protein [Oscillatoriales cyanobacterium C42_A2020_001]|nr:diacylglycerol kinase family protein [Leptolyngbyaceae cyanobacterium C42_A2020_001]
MPPGNQHSHQDLIVRTVLQPMPPELQTPDPECPNGEVVPIMKVNRELAWRVAPTLFISFKYAWAGVSYAFQTQRNFRIHVFLGFLAFSSGILLQLSAVEMAVIGLTVGAVLTMELLNTAIESVVDLTVKQNYHDLAKIAKDCSAAAVLISAFASVGVASSLILPKLWIKLLLLF